MKPLILKNNVKFWIADFSSDFIEDENSEEAKVYYDYFSHIWQGYVDELLLNFAIDECEECSSIKYDDDQYCCTSCWGSEKTDNIEKSFIAKHIPKKDDLWVIGEEKNENLRDLLKVVLPKFGYIIITDK
jgi:hypothetical protein